MAEVKTELLFEIRLDADRTASLQVGATPRGTLRIDAIQGGIFEGQKLKGVVLPGGSDWLLSRPDGVGELNVRLPMRTDDGALISMTYRGIRDIAPEVLPRLLSGEAVERETAAPHYRPLFHLPTVVAPDSGVARERPGEPLTCSRGAVPARRRRHS